MAGLISFKGFRCSPLVRGVGRCAALMGLGAGLCAAAVSADSLLIRGATVHPITGETLAPGEVLVRNGKIVEVAESIETEADRVVRLEGQHLYPGLIAATTPLGLVEINAVRATRDLSEVGRYTPDVQSWIAVNPDSELIPVARANGITHFLPVPSGGVVAGQSGLMTVSGWTVEDMTREHPVTMHVFWPSMGLNTRPKSEFDDPSDWESLEEQDGERKRRIQDLEDFFAEAGAYAKARQAARRDEVTDPGHVPAWEAMVPVLEKELPLMIHADEYRQIKSAVDWAEEREYPVILAGGRDAWRLAGALAEREIPVVFEHVFTLPRRDVDPYDVHYRAPAVLHQAGVKVAFSLGLGGFSASMLRNLPYQAAQAAAFGLPEEEALKGLTLYPAQILGVADQLGSIEPGKNASFFAADGPILDIRSRVTRMWVRGQEISLESRHTRLYEKYKNRPQSKRLRE